MKDGLYQVTTKYFVAGFIITDGFVTECAPILKKKLEYWKSVAVYLGEEMIVRGTIVSVETDIAVPKKDGGNYPGTRIVYKGKDGKIETQAFHNNTFKYKPELKKAIATLVSGDTVDFDKEKNAQDFWEVKSITKVDASAAVAEPTAVRPTASPKSTYETPEERALKQVYIVRQSSIANAISLKPKADVKEILSVAKTFEKYVFYGDESGVSAYGSLEAIHSDTEGIV